MEQILQGSTNNIYNTTTLPGYLEQILPGVICFEDDIRISSATEAEHFFTLEAVMSRLQKYNAKLNADKCQFFVSSVEFLGHVIDESCIHPTQEKLEAIRKGQLTSLLVELLLVSKKNLFIHYYAYYTHELREFDWFLTD